MDDPLQSQGTHSDSAVSTSAAESSAEPAYDARAVGRLYRSISLAGMVMALGGVAVEIYHTGQVRRSLWPLHEVGPAMVSGVPSAWTTMGILVLLTGPILALISMLRSGLNRRSWVAVALSAVVLAIIVLAIPIRTWIEGGL